MAEFFRAKTEAAATELRYLALGDSYTIGEGVPESGRWPVQLAHALRADGLPMADPRIIAQTGWTTDELDAAIDAVHPLAEYDLVSLLIGVNNQYRGRTVDEYRAQFTGLLERATGFAQWRRERVLVLSIPDWGITPFAVGNARGATLIGAEIDAFNFAAREVCRERGIAFVDITAASRERGAEAAMLADDGLHPSSTMYAQWTRLALPVARQLLATP
ncbi:SGNH/GDSL hydrolase family protein [Pseudoxanthomonas sacheonensis]|uniref:SGNH/GDSL hydrolase family protein n=1 Tax=Pseudoxanthomonas sacheonensis TaxID=443615 RepID=UPI0013D6D17C|nr:SGNH/GDSL hydrolase family protein [Pseudoxanthomonas sacheonensis]KAF1707456.1 lysophospholipase [Pseudoxanthomonas sacheonensis]